MKAKTQKVLFGLRLFKHIIDNFIDTFFVLYFLDVSSENIIPLGIYQIITVTTIYFTIYFCRNLSRSKHRVTLMRIAMLLDIAYFLAIIFLQTRVADFAYLLGFLRGLEEGFYYSVYNIIESDGVANKERHKFIGIYKAASSASSIILPIVFGSMINEAGFAKSTLVVIAIVAVRMVLSFLYRERNIPRGKKTNLKKFRELTRNDQRFRRLSVMQFFNGLTASSSALSNLITIYVVSVFSNSFSLGVFTAVFAAVAGAIGIAFARFIRRKHYNSLVGIFSALTTASLILMVFDCNPTTIILFKFWRVASKDLNSVIIDNSVANLCNDPKIKREYKPEFWLNNERYLVTGRVLSGVTFIAMAFMNSWVPMMVIFAALISVFAFTSIRFQRAVQHSGHHHTGRGSRRFSPAYRIISKDKDE